MIATHGLVVLNPWKSDVFHLGFEIGHGGVHASEIPIIFFWDLHAMPFSQLHDDVEEVHAVEFKLIAKRFFIVEIIQIFVW